MGDTLLLWIVAVTFAWGLGCFMTWVLVRGGSLKKCEETREAAADAVHAALILGAAAGYVAAKKKPEARAE